MTITGFIESIEYREISGHEKKVVTLISTMRQRAFIEFRGHNMEILERIKENDEVAIDFNFEGKVSKSTGIQYNNLHAHGIRKLSPS
jgi:hypothetical protein